MSATTRAAAPTVDLGPAARRVAALLPAVRPEQLADPTPCPEFDVATLLDHLLTLTVEFTHAARKSPSAGPVEPSAAHLDPDWRTEVPDRLAELVVAWAEPEAWVGTTHAGGLEFPAEEVGVIALDELVLHGWDLARATRQRFSVDGASARACLGFTAAIAAAAPVPGLFGAAVEVGEGAPLFHQVLGYSGRDPQWAP